MQNYTSKVKMFGIILSFSIAILIFAFLFLNLGGGNRNGRTLDSFAECLTANGAVMYGADWCPHCQNEKNAFGGSFRFVNYVECPAEPKRCIEAGVNGYPTWAFSDGHRLEGEQGLDKLSKESGCPLPDAR